MDLAGVTDLIRESIVLMLVLSLPVLLTVLLAGLIVSLLQAATQVQETTLTFVPKILAAAVAVLLSGPWVLQRLVEFGQNVFGTLP